MEQRQYTDVEKMAGFDYLLNKRQRNKERFGKLMEKYIDKSIQGEPITAHEVAVDLVCMYEKLYISR